MRIAWRTVWRILERLAGRLLKPRWQLAGLCRLGIDEITFRKGQRYLTVVVDHDTGRLVWPAEGRDEKTLDRFFRELGRCRSLRITRQRRWRQLDLKLGPPPLPQGGTRPRSVPCPRLGHQGPGLRPARGLEHRSPSRPHRPRRRSQADSMDAVEERRGPDSAAATKLAWVQRVNQPLYRAHLLKDQLRLMFKLPMAEPSICSRNSSTGRCGLASSPSSPTPSPNVSRRSR